MKNMKPFAKIAVAVAFAALFSLSLAACNTIDGLGRDARAAGDAISGAARETKGY